MEKNTENELEEVKSQLFKNISMNEDILNDLEKANLLLWEWINEYSFNENPTPEAAIKYGREISSKHSITEIQSFKWYWDYNTIKGFVEIVYDYVSKSKDILKESLEKGA